jgi:predicted RNase H-like nuclease
MKLFVGVDGCPRGWFFVAIDDNAGWQVGIVPNMIELWGLFSHSKLILIDIPIGLPWEVPRPCDIQARQMLGPGKASSVFPTPARETIVAKNYTAACRINEHILGTRLSKQTWRITKKIKEVDAFLHAFPEARGKIRETHPEVCYYGLTNRSLKPKKSAEGIQERLSVLEKHFPHVGNLYNFSLMAFPRYAAAKDDILDACVASVTAMYSENGLSTIPEKPDLDKNGLPMEMVYYKMI